MENEMRKHIDTFKNFRLNENKEIRGKCKCLISVKFSGKYSNDMNYFKDYTYNFTDNTYHYTVAYEDGRFTTMIKETFDKYFEII